MKHYRPDPQHLYRTWGKGRAVRLEGFNYAEDVPIHLTICAEVQVLSFDELPQTICDSVEFCSQKLRYELFCYCLMPDHLHVLLSPSESSVNVGDWLQRFKSFTTNWFMRHCGKPPLWQLSANDHICRATETVQNVALYIVNNPVRAGLVERWDDWQWTKLLVEI